MHSTRAATTPDLDRRAAALARTSVVTTPSLAAAKRTTIVRLCYFS